MSSRVLFKLAKFKHTLRFLPKNRSVTTTTSGGVIDEPKKLPLGFLYVGLTILTGLGIGAAISKTMASFLEEHDLFVPADDDDDD